MGKTKFHLEYLLRGSSKNLLWAAISTPTGLEDWFADKVVSEGHIMTFHWGKTEQRSAEVVAQRLFSFVRFHWMDEEDASINFELRMSCNELTGDYVLEITDFADEEDVDDMKELWESQVIKLRRLGGF
ncbi:MAG: START-like domain-containing protein [Bacteroides sp.]|nr:START-like domain-containing protein [Bacteroides sp.]